jgi:hypothetical protein
MTAHTLLFAASPPPPPQCHKWLCVVRSVYAAGIWWAALQQTALLVAPVTRRPSWPGAGAAVFAPGQSRDRGLQSARKKGDRSSGSVPRCSWPIPECHAPSLLVPRTTAPCRTKANWLWTDNSSNRYCGMWYIRPLTTVTISTDVNVAKSLNYVCELFLSVCMLLLKDQRHERVVWPCWLHHIFTMQPRNILKKTTCTEWISFLLVCLWFRVWHWHPMHIDLWIVNSMERSGLGQIKLQLWHWEIAGGWLVSLDWAQVWDGTAVPAGSVSVTLSWSVGTAMEWAHTRAHKLCVVAMMFAFVL